MATDENPRKNINWNGRAAISMKYIEANTPIKQYKERTISTKIVELNLFEFK